ncbi:MAG: glycosyltransferase [Candidatus Altiarchaeota archaeon]
MKVCIVSKHYPPYVGGLESRVRDVAGWMSSRGVEVLVLTSDDSGEGSQIEDGVTVRRSRTLFTTFNAPFTPGVILDLLREEYDVIDVNMPDPLNSIYCLITSVLRGKSLVVTYHADILKDRWYHMPFKICYSIFLNQILARAKAIFATSPNYAESSRILSKFIGKVVVAPSFVDTRRFNPGVDGSRVRERLGLKRKAILFVGRFVSYKGIEYLIEAFRAMRVKHKLDLVLVGAGPLEGELKKMVSESKVEGVHFAGEVPVDELPEYYAACDVLVLPSVTRQEAFGLVLVEAMACGKPVVSTDFSGMPYVVDGAGVLAKPRDPADLASAIYRVLSDEDKYALLSMKARERVEELFTPDVVCGRILETYVKALEGA